MHGRTAEAIDLFEQVVALSPDERDRVLAEACAADAPLRARIERMLRADRRPHRLLDRNAAGFAAGFLDLEHSGWIGRRVGPYHLLRELGRGGMGVVYLAERADVRMQVAVKLLDGRVASPERASRFDQECRVLAGLEHPHIARFLDAGVTPDGARWLAMEYVEGRPIDQHCDARCLSVAERLTLFQQAGAAVACAHSHQLVHRDLKPSNILVSEAGVPKLLDFGIAKLLGDDGPSVTVDHGPGPMTPDYASPEQVRGEPITTASDVYQLGILLHELLTGRRPSGPGGEVLRPFDRANCHEFMRPSTLVQTGVSPPQVADESPGRTAEELACLRRTTPRALGRRLRGDLDNIIARALACTPERRYPSAEELIEDVRRHRKGLAVTASPASPGYRVGRFLRRHRVAAGITGSLMAVALLAGAGFFLQTHRLGDEQDRARQATSALEELVLQADPARLRDDTAASRAMLRGVVAQGRAGLARGETVWGRLLYVAGDVYHTMGRADTAMALWREVIEALEPGTEDSDQVLLLSLGMLGTTLVETGDVAGGLAVLDRLEAAARRLPAFHRAERAEYLYKVAFGRQVAGDDVRARRLNEEVLLLLGGLPDSGGITWDRTLINLGKLANRRGDFVAAESLFRRAVAVRERRDGTDHDRTMNALHGLGEALLLAGRVEEADSVSLRTLTGRERLFDRPHPMIAASQLLRAEVLLAKGQPDEAARLAGEAREMYRALYSAAHPMVIRAEGTLARITGTGAVGARQ